MKDANEAFQDNMENIRARRNHLVAHWAAGRMGYDDTLSEGYGRALHAADHEEPGDADVIRKLRSDLSSRGIRVEDVELGWVLRECHRQALRDTHSTD